MGLQIKLVLVKFCITLTQSVYLTAFQLVCLSRLFQLDLNKIMLNLNSKPMLFLSSPTSIPKVDLISFNNIYHILLNENLYHILLK